MKPVEITQGIYWIGVNDEKTELFEGLWPIKDEGISYNSYLVRGEKTAQIDLCKDIYQEEYLNELKTLVDPTQIDYLVVNHMEPDHSGAMRAFLELAPQAKILCTQKAVRMLEDFFGITENIHAVEDGETQNLGGHVLQFTTVPMVHWPETMVTFDQATGVLFSCDAFGGYGRLMDGIFDDDYADISFFEKESLRYYANIVAAFSKPVLNAGEKLANVEIKIVAPSHGLVWRKDPAHIVDLYMKWSEYGKGKSEKKVALIHGSMYGNTSRAAEAIADGLKASGVELETFDVRLTHASYILPAIWTSQGIAIGAPTYEGSLFPGMAQTLLMAEFKRMFNKDAIYFGSYGWGGGAQRYLGAQLERLKWNLGETLEFAGEPSPDDLSQAKTLGMNFGSKILAG
jgi:flavorubredoxin